LKLKKYARDNRDQLKLASKAFDTNLHKSACWDFGDL